MQRSAASPLDRVSVRGDSVAVMSRVLTRIWRFPTRLLLAILALVSQVALGSLVLPAESAAAELDTVAILCQTGTPDAPPAAPRHHQHAPDCAICPLCAALALPGALLSPAPLLPTPSVHQVARIALPPAARGPPSLPLRISLARGPPVLT
jgi:hypothetical protein